MRAEIVPGAPFPDFDLPDQTGKHQKLSELQGQHPMVLVLSRGGFCPKDHRQSELLVELYREMVIGYRGGLHDDAGFAQVFHHGVVHFKSGAHMHHAHAAWLRQFHRS